MPKMLSKATTRKGEPLRAGFYAAMLCSATQHGQGKVTKPAVAAEIQRGRLMSRASRTEYLIVGLPHLVSYTVVDGALVERQALLDALHHQHRDRARQLHLVDVAGVRRCPLLACAACPILLYQLLCYVR